MLTCEGLQEQVGAYIAVSLFGEIWILDSVAKVDYVGWASDFLAENCKCVVHKKCMFKAPKNCGDSYYQNYTKNGNNMEMVGNFFLMLRQAYSLIIHGW